MRIDKNKVQIKMAKLGINQHELAERADISRQTLSYIINGKDCRPKLFGKICKALDSDPEEMLDATEIIED